MQSFGPSALVNAKCESCQMYGEVMVTSSQIDVGGSEIPRYRESLNRGETQHLIATTLHPNLLPTSEKHIIYGQSPIRDYRNGKKLSSNSNYGWVPQKPRNESTCAVAEQEAPTVYGGISLPTISSYH
jgi:hypothetical protein